MLRHIMSVSLVMTACATLMPTMANAATLTLAPVGTLQKKPGDSIEFILTLSRDLVSENVLKFLTIGYSWDGNELFLREEYLAPDTIIVDNPTIISRFTFDVVQPVKDGISDFFEVNVYYQDGLVVKEISTEGLFDVVPVPDESVPEPLTMFGAAAALGYGAIFKRKYSKKIGS